MKEYQLKDKDTYKNDASYSQPINTLGACKKEVMVNWELLNELSALVASVTDLTVPPQYAEEAVSDKSVSLPTYTKIDEMYFDLTEQGNYIRTQINKLNKVYNVLQ